MVRVTSLVLSVVMLASPLITVNALAMQSQQGEHADEEEKPDEGEQAEDEGEESLIACNARGKQAAKSEVGSGGSMAGGFFAGLLLGLIGTGIAVVVQSEPEVPYHLLPEESEDCKYAFSEGFTRQGKSKKQTAALTGGLLGTLALVVVLVAASSGE